MGRPYLVMELSLSVAHPTSKYVQQLFTGHSMRGLEGERA